VDSIIEKLLTLLKGSEITIRIRELLKEYLKRTFPIFYFGALMIASSALMIGKVLDRESSDNMK
jgi:hypothetical protein